MRIIRFASAGKPARYGLLEGDVVMVLRGKPFGGIKPTGESLPLDSVRLLAPCAPSKIVAIGLNYKSHAGEMKTELTAEPLIFLKPSTAVIGPGESIIYPTQSSRVDYEGELGAVVGRRAHHVSAAEALEYILGYTCFNDVTARDLQQTDGQWTRAKGFDTFAVIGPWIETAFDSGQARLSTYLNGKLVQQGSIRDLIHPLPELISFISDVMTLLPGDVIATGTPAGIGPVRPGDMVEVRIEQLGSLVNPVVREPGSGIRVGRR